MFILMNSFKILILILILNLWRHGLDKGHFDGGALKEGQEASSQRAHVEDYCQRRQKWRH